MEKTGSTSLQSYLFRNADRLRERGVFYPRQFGEGPHVQLTALGLRDASKGPILPGLGFSSRAEVERVSGAALASLAADVTSCRPSQVIVSDEHVPVWLSKVDQLAAYVDAMRSLGDVTRVIMYLRRQDRMLEAMGSEAIKNQVFGPLDFCRFNDQPRALTGPRFQYEQIVNNLEQVCGRESLDLRPYIDDVKPPFDVIRDFMAACRLTVEERVQPRSVIRQIGDWIRRRCEPPARTHQVRLNMSIPGRLLCALGQVGRQASAQGARQVLQEWRPLIRLATDAFPGPTTWISPSARRYLITHFARTNEAICVRYPALRPALCPDGESIAWPTPAKEVAITELAETVGQCLKGDLREEWLAVCAAAT
jgi:hypothetical protein